MATFIKRRERMTENGNTWWEPAVIECICKCHVSLDDGMTNRCGHCGRFYNGCGQLLSHPSNWGEETGESFDDDGNYISGGEY